MQVNNLFAKTILKWTFQNIQSFPSILLYLNLINYFLPETSGIDNTTYYSPFSFAANLSHSPDCQVPLNTQLHKPLKWFCFHFPSHNHNHLISEFHIWFPAKVSSRRTLKHKSKIWKTILKLQFLALVTGDSSTILLFTHTTYLWIYFNQRFINEFIPERKMIWSCVYMMELSLNGL